MTRILKLLGFASLAMSVAASAMAQEVTLRVHQMLPIQATIPDKAINPWIEKVQAESDGRITIEHYPAMQLGGTPPSLYDQARDGVVDIIWTVLGYTPGRFPKTEAFELPFMTGDAESSSKAFHEWAEANAMDEFQGVKVIAFHTHGPGFIHSNKAVNTLEDVSGLKLRGPTQVTTAMLEKFGATAIGMPVPAVPESISKGVIDGAVVPWEVTMPLRLSEMVKNHTGFESAPGLYTATFVFAMNQGSYDGLPDDLKAVIDANSGVETAGLFGAAMDENDAIGSKMAEDAGNAIVLLDDEEKARWMEASQSVVTDWIAAMDAKGLDGQGLVDGAKAAIAKYEGGS
jgi:TRAP-type transport system periplasmic protein